MAPEEKSFIGPNVATGGKAQEGGPQPTLLGQPEWLTCFCSQRKDICTNYSRSHMQMKFCVPIFNNSDSNPLDSSSGKCFPSGLCGNGCRIISDSLMLVVVKSLV